MKNRLMENEKLLTHRDAQLPFGWVRLYWRGDVLVRSELLMRARSGSDRQTARLVQRVWRSGTLPEGLKLDLSGVGDFSRRVLRRCRRIRFGQVMSYGALARAVGKPGAARAVGQVLAHNRFPLLFPCHRVIAGDRRLGGFTAGLRMKARVLECEGWRVNGSGKKARVVAR